MEIDPTELTPHSPVLEQPPSQQDDRQPPAAEEFSPKEEPVRPGPLSALYDQWAGKQVLIKTTRQKGRVFGTDSCPMPHAGAGHPPTGEYLHVDLGDGKRTYALAKDVEEVS